MVLEIEGFEREKFTALPNFLETTGRNVATKGDIAKTASSRPSHGIFMVFASCKSVSTILFLVTKKFDR